MGKKPTYEQLLHRVHTLDKESCELQRLNEEITNLKDQLKERNALILSLAEQFPNSYLSVISKDFTIGKTFGVEFDKLKLPGESFVGLKLEDIYGEDSDFIKEKYQKTFEGEQLEFEFSYNGQAQLYKTFPIRSNSEKIEKILVICENITEKKQAEIVRRNSIILEKELSDIINFSPIAITIGDKQGRLEKCNEALEELTGYSELELLEFGFLKKITPKKWHALEDQMLRSISITNKNITYEKELIHKTGKIIPIEISATASFNENLEIENIFTFKIDISTRKKNEENLISQNINLERFSFIHKKTEEIAKVGGWEVDLKSNSNFWTDEVYTIHETTREEHIPTMETGVKFYTKESVPILTKALEKAMQNGEKFDEKLQIITAKGNLKDVWVLGYVESDDDGNQESIYGIIQDITEQKQLESELINAKEKAEESNQLKSAFLASISHEIRTPLNAILGFSKLLCQEGLTVDQRKLYSNQVEQGNTRLLAIINSILELSTIESENIKIIWKSCNLNNLIDDLLSNFDNYEFKGKTSIRTNYGLDYEDATFYIDEKKIVQILKNLIENGLKFTNGGLVEIGYSVNQDKIHFYVRDNGRGIHPNNHKAIFQRFTQIDIDYSKSITGTGLGLAIVDKLISILDGEIWVDSTLGKGSTFHFTIPCYKAEPK